jgi:hypothetical protein
MQCGQSEASHTAATYVSEATAADVELDEQLAIFRRELDAGEITAAAEAATERSALWNRI